MNLKSLYLSKLAISTTYLLNIYYNSYKSILIDYNKYYIPGG
jgi:hypothetical protein